MKHWRISAFLLVLLIILGFIAYWDEVRTKNEDEIAEEEKRVISFKVEDVVEFFFESHEESGNVSVSLVKREGRWRFKDDLQVLADQATVESLLKSIGEYRYERELSFSEDYLVEYGLKPPRRSITFSTVKDERYSLDLGHETSVGYSVYFAVNGESLYSGPQYILQATDKKAIDFRDRAILKNKNITPDRIEYVAGGEKMMEAKKVEGEFVITFPRRIAADQAVIEDFIDTIKTTEVKEYIDTPSKDFVRKYLGSDGVITVHLYSGAEQLAAIEFAAVDNGFWLRKSDGSFGLLPDRQVRKLTKHLVDFRDRQLFKMMPSEVEKLTVNGVDFERFQGEFYRLKDGKRETEKLGRLDNFLADLLYAKAQDIVPKSEMQSQLRREPLYNIVLKKPVGSTKIKVWLDTSRVEMYFVALNTNTEELYLLPQKIFHVLDELFSVE